jgi:predicted RNA-binding Zn-ribbon protein involved in translation (DUF1610 family)
MSDSTRDLLMRGIAAAKANSKAEARFYLEWVTRDENAAREETIDAWRYLAEISDDANQKRDCLEQVLAHQPGDPAARRALAILNGELNPAEIVDPDRMSAATTSASPLPAPARRFVCLNCGGRMSFTPDGNALACAYCGKRQSLMDAMESGAIVEEQNFIVALATAKGHSHPVLTQSIQCTSCGATLTLSPQSISQTCPFCATPYVLEQAETRERIPPEGILPFAVSREQANRAVLEWYRAEGFKILSVNALPSGVYLPVWTFDVGGTIEWNCLIEVKDAWIPQAGSHLVYENDLPIAAGHSLSATLLEQIAAFSLDRILPYDARYLADWHAETYQVEVGDASLVARTRALEKVRPKITAGITDNFRDLRLSATRLVIESYKLILLPLWIARYRYEQEWFCVVVNGQTGTVRGEKPPRGIRKWISERLT